MGKGARSRTQRVLLKEQVVRMGASNQIAASPTAATDRADEEADGQIQAGIAPFAGHAEHENALEAENARLKAENAQLLAEIAKLEMLNGWYLEQFRLAQQRRFGASSEKTAPTNQLSLFNEAELIADTEPPDEPEETVTYTRKKRKGKREDFFEGLPTEQVIHELPEDERICPICGGLLRECGHEVLRREVEIIPAQVKAVEHVQTVYSCDDCARNPESEVTTMVKAPVPAPVIAGSGIASPSLLSFILCNKYVLALPLNRQEEELKRMNIHISRQTMANWAVYSAMKWLDPIYKLLHADLVLCSILHADETRVQVVKEKGREASKQSFMWVYCTGKAETHHIALFEYQQTREGRHPQSFLEGFGGYLHVDGYSGYRALEERGVTLTECWSHMRRKLDEVLKALPKGERNNSHANIGMKYCNQLFALERKYDEEGIGPEDRSKRREIEARPIAEDFFAWAESVYAPVYTKTKLGAAVTYAANQQPRLMNYFLDGRLEMTNNRCERQIYPFAIGRNNWKFAFSEKGAKASAIIYSIVETALLNDLVPITYLKYLFEMLPNIPVERYSECLPWNPVVQQLCRIPDLK